MWVVRLNTAIKAVSERLSDIIVGDFSKKLRLWVEVVAIGDPRDSFALRHALRVPATIAQVAPFNAGEVLVQWGTRGPPVLPLVPHETTLVGAVDGPLRLDSKGSFDAGPQADVGSMSAGDEGREDYSFYHFEG